MRKLFVIITAFLFLPGCALFPELSEEIVNGVDEYCVRVTPTEREVIRSQVNAALASKGHSIAVNCAGDG